MANEVETNAPPAPPSEVRRPLPSRRPKRSWVREHPAALLVGLVVPVILIVAGVYLWNYLSSYESTDDAQIDGNIYPVSARIVGRVTAVNVDSNQPVTQGQVLIQLDPTDYKVAMNRAEADLAQAAANAAAASTQIPITTTTTASQTSGANAGVAEANAGIAMAQQQHEAAQAHVREAQANYEKAQRDVERYRPLVEKQEISRQQFDQAVATANALRATVETAQANADAAARAITQARARLSQAQAQQAGMASAPQEIAGQRARAASSAAAAQMSKASLDMARLNVQYTTIVAPVSGVVGQKNVQPGQQVTAGQPLLSVIPLEDLWVTANFKETQLKRMRVGQRASLAIDAIGQTLKGHVDSFPGATGAKYSLLPPENATGNYVKVVQRLPVKIVFEPGENNGRLLRPGMSVTVKVWMK